MLYSYYVVHTHVVLSYCAVNRARCGGRVVYVGKYACTVDIHNAFSLLSIL